MSSSYVPDGRMLAWVLFGNSVPRFLWRCLPDVLTWNCRCPVVRSFSWILLSFYPAPLLPQLFCLRHNCRTVASEAKIVKNVTAKGVDELIPGLTCQIDAQYKLFPVLRGYNPLCYSGFNFFQDDDMPTKVHGIDIFLEISSKFIILHFTRRETYSTCLSGETGAFTLVKLSVGWFGITLSPSCAKFA